MSRESDDERDELTPERGGVATMFDRGARRYEPVVAVICVIVLLARFGPGGSEGDLAGARAVTPFDSADVSVPAASPTSSSVSTTQPTRASIIDEGDARTSPTPTSPPQSSTTAPMAPPPEPPPQDIGVDLVSSFAVLPVTGDLGGLAVSEAGHVFVGVSADDDVAAAVVRLDEAGKPVRTYELDEVSGRVSDVLATEDPSVIAVLGASPARVVLLDLESGGEGVFAAIPDVPPCVPVILQTGCDGSLIDRAPSAQAMAADREGNLYVTDSAQGAVWRIDDGDDTPYQFVVGSDLAGPTGVDGELGVHGIEVDGGGNLILTTVETDAGPGGVLLQEVGVDGTPGSRSALYHAEADEQLGKLELGVGGTVYVVARGRGQLLTLDNTGDEVDRLPADQGALGSASGLAFHGTGLLVSARLADVGDASVVLRVETGEAGGPDLWRLR